MSVRLAPANSTLLGPAISTWTTRSTGAHECDTCDREFRSAHSVQQHMNALGHWAPRFSCDTCTLKFHTESAADEHMQHTGHWQAYCSACDIHFQNENNLQMVCDSPPDARLFSVISLINHKHLRSRIHRGTNVGCPFCEKGFTTASGLSAHLETSACPNAPSLSRESILAILRKRDPYGVITNKQIEWYDEEGSSYEVTLDAWNGDAWECPMCDSKFSSVHGLRMHLQSPRHKGKVYHCPNKRGGCEKEFVSLAALFNHLESESCSYMKFENVQRHVKTFFTGRQMISI